MTALDSMLGVPVYPLVVPGDTLMNDDQLLRYISERCCEDVANVVRNIMTGQSVSERISEYVKSTLDALEDADTAVSNAKADLRQLASIL